jgi:hypothetical protein
MLLRLEENFFYKDSYLMKVIYLYYNIFVILNVLIFALELVDENKILKQIDYGFDQFRDNKYD